MSKRVTNLTKHQSGFTLLELMISAALMALLISSLFAAFHNLSTAWDKAHGRIESTQDERIVSRFIRHQLAGAMVVRVRDEGADVFAFEGDAYSVRYVAPLRPLKHLAGVFMIELKRESSEQGQALYLRFAPYRPELSWDEALEDVEPVLVFDGFDDLEFAYFAATNLEEDPQWLSEWIEQPVFPLLFKVMMRRDQQKAWPEVVVDLPQVDAYVQGG